MKKTFFTVAVAIVCAVAAQAQVFYKVSGNGLQKPSYIFGTHHLAPLSMLDSIPSAKAALDETERAVGEVDMTGGQMAACGSYAAIYDGPSRFDASRPDSPR